MNVFKAIAQHIFPLLVFVVALSSCADKTRDDGQFSNDVGAAYQSLKTDQNQLKIESITHFDWDQLLLFPPYTPVSVIAKAIGTPITPAIADTGIDARDDINVMVFVKNKTVIKVCIIPRNVVDFNVAKDIQALDHHSAVFLKSTKDKTLVLAHLK